MCKNGQKHKTLVSGTSWNLEPTKTIGTIYMELQDMWAD